MEQTTIGRYQLRQELAQGGTGVVYRAYDPLLKREVALKVLWAHLFAGKPDLAQQFEREAEIIASLEHHSIIPLYDFGRDGEQRYFVRRFMKGGTLAARLAGVPLTLEETTGILVRVGSALQKAHSSGVTHRDLRPNNVLFDEGGYAYLSDFGMIKTENLPEVTSDGVQTLGIPAYMSPEQLEGRTVDGRSDIYSLGIILFEMLAGRKPFDHSSVARLIVMQLTQPAPSLLQVNPALPPGLEAVIQRAMAKEPESRYLSADEMVQAFREAVDAPVAAVPHRSGVTIPLPGKPAAEKDRARPQEAATALAAVGKHVEAAEAWCEAEELEEAAGQYELAGRWS
jgi:serine/threonine-protein kinase